MCAGRDLQSLADIPHLARRMTSILTDLAARSSGLRFQLQLRSSERFLDGVYVYRDDQPPRFLRVKAPDKNELEALVQRISKRVGRCLERQGLLESDAESAWLDLEPAENTDAMPQILGSSVSYRVAVGP